MNQLAKPFTNLNPIHLARALKWDIFAAFFAFARGRKAGVNYMPMHFCEDALIELAGQTGKLGLS
jgi:hypothetical protein